MILMLARIGTAVAAVIALFVVFWLYVGGSPILALMTSAGFGVAFFVYTARRAYSYRYLFPGLAGIALFIVLPVLYTVWIAFTNYSSKHLLTFERATEVLLGETYLRDDVSYQFTLHADGGGFRIVLQTGDDSASDTARIAETSMLGDAADAGVAGAAGSAAAGEAPPATGPPPVRRLPAAFVTKPLALTGTAEQRVPAVALAGSGFAAGEPLPLKDVIEHRDALRAVTVQLPDGSLATMASLREFTPREPLYRRNVDGTLTNQKTGEHLAANFRSGFYESATGRQASPGFRAYVAGDNYVRAFTDDGFRGPFIRVFLWTVAFAALTVVLVVGLGILLAEVLSWEGLRFGAVYRILLFLPYAVPGFISILVFKGLFNRNFGEINLILDTLFGIRPNWFGNAWLARIMILIVNTWLGYPYFMLMGMGLQKSIPRELYEASAIAGASPLTNFFKITWPLIRKPLMPLVIAAFAYNFNNFVVIFLLTAGRPDFLDTSVPAGETDILVSYTYRIAFEDSGQNFGLAATVATLIFVIVAILSIINMRLTKTTAEDKR
jgi:maltose/maltodextrin transport system permease protein